MSFSEEIKKETDRIQRRFKEVMQGAAIACFDGIIKQSPVDTGRFRANWFVDGSQPSSKVTTAKDKAGVATAARSAAFIVSAKDWTDYTLTNNLPYAEVIEFGKYPNPPKRGSLIKKATKRKAAQYEALSENGFSRQAPEGVVRINILRTKNNLEKVQL